MLVALLTGFVNSINTVRVTACGFCLRRVSATGHETCISSALLKLSHTKGVAEESSEVTPELAQHAGELRVRMSRLARRLRREDRGHELTMSQLSALSRLDRMGAATLSELAAGERVRPQSMARTLDSLEAAGMVQRTPHPTDRRRHVIALTGTGHAVIAQNRLRRDAWLARAMTSALSPEERDLLIRAGALMDRLAEFADLVEEDDPAGPVAGV
jgi:DNA-binding MarR family transcriptional regulator